MFTKSSLTALFGLLFLSSSTTFANDLLSAVILTAPEINNAVCDGDNENFIYSVTNNSNNPVILSSIILETDNTQLAITGGTCASQNFVLKPMSTCTSVVTFTPNACEDWSTPVNIQGELIVTTLAPPLELTSTIDLVEYPSSLSFLVAGVHEAMPVLVMGDYLNNWYAAPNIAPIPDQGIIHHTTCKGGSSDTCFAVGTDNTHTIILRTDSVGNTWEEVSPVLQGEFTSIDAIGTHSHVVGNDFNNRPLLLTSEDSGETWSAPNIGVTEGRIHDISCVSRVCVAVGSGQSVQDYILLLTTDSGINWSTPADGPSFGTRLKGVSCAGQNSITTVTCAIIGEDQNHMPLLWIGVGIDGKFTWSPANITLPEKAVLNHITCVGNDPALAQCVVVGQDHTAQQPSALLFAGYHEMSPLDTWTQPKIEIPNPEEIPSTFAKVACFYDGSNTGCVAVGEANGYPFMNVNLGDHAKEWSIPDIRTLSEGYFTTTSCNIGTNVKNTSCIAAGATKSGNPLLFHSTGLELWSEPKVENLPVKTQFMNSAENAN